MHYKWKNTRTKIHYYVRKLSVIIIVDHSIVVILCEVFVVQRNVLVKEFDDELVSAWLRVRTHGWLRTYGT